MYPKPLFVSVTIISTLFIIIAIVDKTHLNKCMKKFNKSKFISFPEVCTKKKFFCPFFSHNNNRNNNF